MNDALLVFLAALFGGLMSMTGQYISARLREKQSNMDAFRERSDRLYASMRRWVEEELQLPERIRIC